MKRLDRRDFLKGGAALSGAALLAGCGSSSGIKADTGGGGSSSAAPVTYGGDISSEPNKLVIAEWPGYEAGGTKAQTYGLLAGKSYSKEFGASTLKYADYGNDDKTLNAMRAGQKFDLLHPCDSYVQDYVNAGVVEPFDTSLLTNFPHLYPEMTARGKVNGQQYWIPWDWGYSSILYRKDKVDPADVADGWNLFWNEKYKGKISMWDGGSTPVRIAGLLTDPPAKNIDHQTPEELQRSKELLIKQKPLNKFYWTSEYGNMQPAFKSGDIWITYSWANDYVDMGKALGFDKVDFMTAPPQGPLAWICGFMLGKGMGSPLHAHKYVDSFIEHKACVNLTNLFAYGNSDQTTTKAEITNQALADKLRIGDPSALDPPVHLEVWIPNRADYQRVWAEVKAS
jgi:spermidine/putrescine transport system substrate-binding protein